MRRTIVSTLILSLLASCATVSPETIKPITRVVDTFCATYAPVYTSRRDTEETKKQVDKNNAVYLVRCTHELDVKKK